ncbi:MAG: hypothetical protein R6X16_02805 [Anaerolineae bacterium]
MGSNVMLIAVLLGAADTSGVTCAFERMTLSFGGVLRTQFGLQFSDVGAVRDYRAQFSRSMARFDLAAEFSAPVRVVMSVDLSRPPSVVVEDLYGCIDLGRCDLTLGQFVAPLGLKAQSHPSLAAFPYYSFVKDGWKPWDPRDVGMQVSYRSAVFDARLALMNGNGRSDGLADDNRW